MGRPAKKKWGNIGGIERVNNIVRVADPELSVKQTVQRVER